MFHQFKEQVFTLAHSRWDAGVRGWSASLEGGVRCGLARALSRDIRVIPVLVGGAPMPTTADLPEDLQGLTLRQAVVLHDETWHQDVDGLVRSLRGEPTVPTKRSRRWLAIGTATAVLLAVGAVSWWRWGPGSGAQASSSGSGTSITGCPSTQSNGWGLIKLSKDPTATEKQPDGGSLTFSVEHAYWRADGGQWQVILDTSMRNDTPQTVDLGDWLYKYLVVADRGIQAELLLGAPRHRGIRVDQRRACRFRGYVQAGWAYPTLA
jgi:hypothetical protein